MSTVLAHCASATGAKTGATPLLCAAPAIKYYRRSTTNKAPRKRTFLVTMTKFDSTLVSPPGVASVFANNVAMLSGTSCCCDEAPSVFGGDGGNNGRFGGHNNGGNNGNGGQGGFGDEAPRLPIFQLNHALLGAVALTVAIAAFPAHSTAASALTGGSFSSSPAASLRPRSKVLHVATEGGTLVVPLPSASSGAGDSKFTRSFGRSRARVVEAPIQLHVQEAAMVVDRQYRVRESMVVA